MPSQMGLLAGCLAPFLRYEDLINVGATCKYLRDAAGQDAAWRSALAGFEKFPMPAPDAGGGGGSAGSKRPSIKQLFKDWVLQRRAKLVCDTPSRRLCCAYLAMPHDS